MTSLAVGNLTRDQLFAEPSGAAFRLFLSCLMRNGRHFLFYPVGTDARTIERLRSPLAGRLAPFLVGTQRERLRSPDGKGGGRGRTWRFVLCREAVDVVVESMPGLWSVGVGEPLQDLSVVEGSVEYLTSSAHEREAFVWWDAESRRRAMANAELRACFIEDLRP